MIYSQGKTTFSFSQIKSRPSGETIPPSEYRKLIDKTAEYVAQSGQEFETLLITIEAKNPKFDFLKNNHPYRAYYSQKISEFRNQKIIWIKEEKNLRTDILEEQVITHLEIMKIQEESTEDGFTENVDPNIPQLNEEIMKHTAQYVARYGESFMIKLREKEKWNPEFYFLKPSHPTFSYFTSLVAGYSQSLWPSIETLQSLNNLENEEYVLERAYASFEQGLKKRMKENSKLDEVDLQREVNWDSFTVMETINMGEETESSDDDPASESRFITSGFH